MKRIGIRPDRRGVRAPLFDLEADVMETVWSKGWDRFTVADVHAVLRRRREIAYTTVLTTVTRLFDKELLTRERQGRRHVYRPAMGRREFLRAAAKRVLDSLPEIGREEAVALLADRVAEADEEELALLEARIRQRRRELES